MDDELTRGILHALGSLERCRRRYMNDRLKSKGMRGTMLMTILYLKRNPGASQDELCQELLMDKANCARLCRTLEDQGRIRRERSDVNRRQNKLYLTELGKSELPEFREMFDGWRDAVTDGMNVAEAQELLRLLRRMAERAEQTDALAALETTIE